MSCTAHFAIAADTFLAFLDFHTTTVTGGDPPRTRKLVNGHALPKGSDHARQIRRWRQRGGTVTRKAATSVLGAQGLTLEDFAYWCEVRSIPPLVRGEL